METALKDGDLAPVINGWRLTFHMFDYNLDHLGPGTIDDPMWKMADRTVSYLARALAARGGLWGKPRLRGRIPDDLRRQRRPGARWAQPVHPDLRPGPAGRRLLVHHHVRPARLLSSRQPDRPLLHRRPYPWPAPRRRRIAHHRDPARPALIPATGCPPPPRRSGRSCACTSRGLPY